jgi:imidazolonepropionase-like amidohydrolase
MPLSRLFNRHKNSLPFGAGALQQTAGNYLQWFDAQRTHNTMKIFSTALFLLLTAHFVIASDQIPGAPQTKPILLTGGTIHTVSEELIDGGSILIVDGKIQSIGKSVKQPEDCEVIELSKDQHVYPGLIDSISQLGLVEIDSVSATIDTSETGSINPNVKAAVAVNPDSEAIPVARANGVLLATVAPSGGFVSGQSAFMMLDGWTWEDMTLQPNLAMHIGWPRFSSRRGNTDREAALDRAEDQIEEFRTLILKARDYAAARSADSSLPVDARLESMLPMVNGEQPIVVSADGIEQIESAISFASQEGLRIIIYGGYDAPECAELLTATETPVILAGTYRTARFRHDGYDVPYALPAKLQELGIPFCICGSGQFGAANVRNLPYQAATAVAYGLDEDVALRSITLSAAEIMGVADRVGSLEVGKDATLFIADGDILETATHVTAAFIQGRTVDLTSRHTQLYEKYKEKYDRIRGE